MPTSWTLLVCVGVLVLTGPVLAEPSDVWTLSLPDAVRLAVERNLDIRVARLETGVGRQSVDIERAAFDPVFTTQLFGEQISSSILSPFQFTPGPVSLTTGLHQTLPSGSVLAASYQVFGNQADFSSTTTQTLQLAQGDLLFSATVPLLRGAGQAVNEAPMRKARLAARDDVLALDQQAQDVACDVERAWWNLALAEQVRKVRQAGLARARQFERDVQSGISTGVYAPYEALEPQQKVAEREADLTAADGEVRVDELQILRLLHSDPNVQHVSLKDVPSVSAATLDVDSLRDEALHTRTEPQRAHLALQSAEVEGVAEHNKVLPQLDVVGEMQVSTPRRDFDDWRVGVAFGVPLGNREGNARYERSRLQIEQAKARVELSERLVSVEVERAVRQLETAQRRLQAISTARGRAAERLESEKLRFQVGLTPAHQVIFFEDALLDVEVTEATAVIQDQLAAVDLDRAVGRSLTKYGLAIAAQSP